MQTRWIDTEKTRDVYRLDSATSSFVDNGVVTSAPHRAAESILKRLLPPFPSFSLASFSLSSYSAKRPGSRSRMQRSPGEYPMKFHRPRLSGGSWKPALGIFHGISREIINRTSFRMESGNSKGAQALGDLWFERAGANSSATSHQR